MSKGILDTLKADTQEAAYRVASAQIMKVAKDGVLSVMRKRGIDNKYVESISDFIDTELGTAMLSTCVGLTFSYIPPFKNDKRAKLLAKEFRVGGMALAGNLLADKAIQDVLPKLSSILDVLPKLQIKETSPKIRLAETNVSSQDESNDDYGSDHQYEFDVWN